jgi:hypothetical protein
VGLINFVKVQNPAAALVSSAFASSRFSLKLWFTPEKIARRTLRVNFFPRWRGEYETKFFNRRFLPIFPRKGV